MSRTSEVLALGDHDFGDVVLGSGVPVVVAFHAQGSSSCRPVGATLEQLARELPMLAFGRVDALANPVTVTAYEVTGLPTYMVFDRGEPVLTVLGTHPWRTLRELVERATRPQPA